MLESRMQGQLACPVWRGLGGNVRCKAQRAALPPYATRLINQGVPITVIQKLLGHNDLNTTQRYAKIADPTVEREYRQAMTEIEQGAGALSLAPLPLPDIWPAPIVAARDRVTLPLDNSM